MDAGGSDLSEHCLPSGVPVLTGAPYPLQIIQNPDQIAILYEVDHLFRVIPTDGRSHRFRSRPDMDGEFRRTLGR